MIGIIGAMTAEVSMLIDIIDNAKVEYISGKTYYIGTISNVGVVLSVSGVGKVNSAITAEAMILKYKPDCIIHIGIAGGVSKYIEIDDTVVPEITVNHDVYRGIENNHTVDDINTVEIPCHPRLVQMLEYAGYMVTGKRPYRGTLATGEQFIGSDDKRDYIREEFSAIAVDMESASIAHVCYCNKVNCAMLKSISDSANSDSEKTLEKTLMTTVQIPQVIMVKFIDLYKESELYSEEVESVT